MHTNLIEISSKEFLEVLSSDAPAPGGGAVVALVGALAAALTSMVGNLTLGKKNYEGVQDEVKTIIVTATSLRQDLEDLVSADAMVFGLFMDAYRLPKNTEEDKQKRQAAIEAAALEAIRVPYLAGNHILDVMRIALQIADIGNKNLITDAVIAGILGRAAIKSSFYNVKINLGYLTDAQQRQQVLADLDRIETEACRLEEKVRELTDRQLNL